ncbi:MAG TPA: hypothetical protein VF847_02205 [Candidatus Deferrimicrobiaceae bacterium]
MEMTTMGKRKALVAMLGLLLAMGTPYLSALPVQADPGSGPGHGHHAGGCPDCPHHGECAGCPGCGCECGYPKGAGGAGPHPMQDNAAAGHGGMHGRMHGGKDAPPMKERMAKHLEEMRGAVKQLREIEAKMTGQIKDGESFRQLSLEHAKLLTDIQASHLRHMEGMMGGGK